MTNLLWLLLAILVLAIFEGTISQRRLRAEIARARHIVPTDDATGLLNHHAYRQRIAGELKRAARADGSVWLVVVTVVDGDPEQFGRVAADGLRFPEVGFRLAERVFCFVRPNASAEQRRDVLARLRAAQPTMSAAIGQSAFPDGPAEPVALLHDAIARMRQPQA